MSKKIISDQGREVTIILLFHPLQDGHTMTQEHIERRTMRLYKELAVKLEILICLACLVLDIT